MPAEEIVLIVYYRTWTFPRKQKGKQEGQVAE